jgi:hypothetical protein
MAGGEKHILVTVSVLHVSAYGGKVAVLHGSMPGSGMVQRYMEK